MSEYPRQEFGHLPACCREFIEVDAAGANLWNHLPAVAGADYYEAFWQGNKDPSDSEITETLNEALLLLQYFNPDWNDIDWQPALDKVMSGEAAMTAFLAIGPRGTSRASAKNRTVRLRSRYKVPARPILSFTRSIVFRFQSRILRATL